MAKSFWLYPRILVPAALGLVSLFPIDLHDNIYLDQPIEAAVSSYYVASEGSDDRGDGSWQRPWATIRHALESLPIQGGLTLWVADGVYDEYIYIDREFHTPVWVKASNPYHATITNSKDNTTLVIRGRNIHLEGFEITGDRDGPPGGGFPYGDEVMWFWECDECGLENNVLHDSYEKDLLSIQGGSYVSVRGNMFYNVEGWDEEVDVNYGAQEVVIEENVFFRDYEGSTRPNNHETVSFIVVKSSDRNPPPTRDVFIRRNLFLHYQGHDWGGIIRLGEDDEAPGAFEAEDVLIENNLVLLNGTDSINAILAMQGVRGITVRANTFAGNLVGDHFLCYLQKGSNNPKNREIMFYNNLFSDTSGSMPSLCHGSGQVVEGGVIRNNLYWNQGAPIPEYPDDYFNYTDDPTGTVADPLLRDSAAAPLPRWTGSEFNGGFRTVRDVFVTYVTRYGKPAAGSPVVDSAEPEMMPSEDILGRSRGVHPDLGAFEVVEDSVFVDVPFDHPYRAEIEALYQAGYTAGCGTDPLRYCPDETMIRAESAVFVERGIHDAEYEPSIPAASSFADVPAGYWGAGWIEGLWEDGYTAGCGADPLIYCPLQEHTRAEGCVFYLRMLNGPDYQPPEPSGEYADVPVGWWGAGWVEAAVEAGLIELCETEPEARFCPQDPLDRGLAAHMMVQAKRLFEP